MNFHNNIETTPIYPMYKKSNVLLVDSLKYKPPAIIKKTEIFTIPIYKKDGNVIVKNNARYTSNIIKFTPIINRIL